MTGTLARPFRFFLERWIQRGVLHQLLAMAALVAAVAVLGGVAAWAMTPAFETLPQAVWWSFLRLTDPGYLGDDEGAALRVISTVVTVLGYVIFMGSLIAIMTQWLARTLLLLESGLTPISMKDHVVILGWTSRTPEVVLKLLGARGRLQRFLDRQDVHRLRIVILSDEVGTERRHELRTHLGELWDERALFLRTGSSLRAEHLERLDLGRAAVVVVPGADFELGGAEMTDTRVVKTLLSVAALLRELRPEEPPAVVAEIFDPLKKTLAERTMDAGVEVVASDRVISRLISQSVRHRGLAHVLIGLLSHREGNTLYVRELPELVGRSLPAAARAFPKAVPLGIVGRRSGELVTTLNPGPEELLQAGDQLVLLAESYDACTPRTLAGPEGGSDGGEPVPTAAPQGETSAAGREYRVLVLGWSHKMAALLGELGQSSGDRFRLTVVSRIEAEAREPWLAQMPPAGRHVQVDHVVADYALEQTLLQVQPASHDHVLLLSSSWLDSAEEADARTILGFVLLRSLLKGAPDPPEILVELMDPDNARLFDETEQVVLVSPRLMSHLLAHVALRPDLNSVFDALFGADGPDIDLRPARELGLVGRRMSFAELQEHASRAGMVALGIGRTSGGSCEVNLNPERRRTWELGETDRIVVLAADRRSGA